MQNTDVIKPFIFLVHLRTGQWEVKLSRNVRILSRLLIRFLSPTVISLIAAGLNCRVKECSLLTTFDMLINWVWIHQYEKASVRVFFFLTFTEAQTDFSLPPSAALAKRKHFLSWIAKSSGKRGWIFLGYDNWRSKTSKTRLLAKWRTIQLNGRRKLMPI